jgi:hypothetical protein
MQNVLQFFSENRMMMTTTTNRGLTSCNDTNLLRFLEKPKSASSSSVAKARRRPKLTKKRNVKIDRTLIVFVSKREALFLSVSPCP